MALVFLGLSACAAEGDDPIGGNEGAATNLPSWDLQVSSPALAPTLVEGGSVAWTVHVKNVGSTVYEGRANPALVRLEVTGQGTGTLSAGSGCSLAGPNVWLCEILSLPVGDSRGYGVDVVAGSAGLITLSATVTPLEDADPTNNSVSQVITVLGRDDCPDPGPCMEFTGNPRVRCEMAFRPAGTTCEEVGCLTGVCDGQGQCGQLASKCEDGACTTSTCDETTNRCVTANKNDGLVCASSSPCEGPGRCEAGVCNGADAVVCDDGNACTDDACVMGSNRRYACQNTPKVCPGFQNCGVGVCDPATGACSVEVDHGRCDDGLDCTDDLCTSSGCSHIPRHDRCSDSNRCDALLPVCDGVLGCIETECRPRIHGDCSQVVATSCDDGDGCTVDSCDPGTGECGHMPRSCDDGNPCTTDGCDTASGRCTNTPRGCDDNDPCTVDSCDAATGQCRNTPKDCNDGNLCTTDSCDATTGHCRNSAIVCDDGNRCNGSETCEPTKGCLAGTPLVCNDGNACNGVETCVPATGCKAGQPVSCDDGNACTADSCNPANGQCAHVGATCNDNDPCTEDACDTTTGQCRFTPKSCDDGVACTADSCVHGVCRNTPRHDQCSDNDACNGVETCDAVAGCRPGSPLACDDGNVCTTDRCDPVDGCRYTNNINPCDDGNVCNNACLLWDVEPAVAWTATNYSGGMAAHGFWLPGFNGPNLLARMTLQSDVVLAWWDEGTARLTGTAVVTSSTNDLGLGDRYAIDMHFVYRGQGAAGEGSGGPKLSPLVDYADSLDWHYFDLVAGGLVGVGNTNDTVTFVQYPANSAMPFQVGLGANDKTLDFGAATWLSFTRSSSRGATSGVGDLNVDLSAFECETGDRCVDGQCVGRGPVHCDDGDPCTADRCDATNGCVSEPIAGCVRTRCESRFGPLDLGPLVDHLFVFAEGGTDANWQGATKGFVGDVVVDGITAAERTSGGVPYAGTVTTNDTTLGAWASIVTADANQGQAFQVVGATAKVSDLEARLRAVMAQVDALPVTTGYGSVSAQSLDGLDLRDGVATTFVANVTSGFGVSTQINIWGDAADVVILRWDTDANPANGRQGQVKFQSGGAIVPRGGLRPTSFLHVAGDINASGGGNNPPAPYPQGPRLDSGLGELIAGGKNFSGGGFFTGYWFTTGKPDNGESASLSNAIFVGGWYTLATKFSMTSGTSGVHVCR